MSASTIEFEKRGPVAEIRLNRPEKLNAVNAVMRDALGVALDRAIGDRDVRAVILWGAGRAFSSGFDLDMGRPEPGMSREEFLRRELKRDFELIMRFWDCPKPTIAAVHGYCLGSSMEIAAVCDITIAADDCRFGAPEVRYGSGIVCMILPWIIGLKCAKEMLLRGGTDIDARRAEAIGLVNRVVSATELMDEARRIAGDIALNDPTAVALTKKAINQCLEAGGLRAALESALETDIEIEITETAESRAFNEILERDGSKAALAWRAAQLPEIE